MLLASCAIFSIDVSAQEFTVQLTPSNHHGYNVSCFGGKDGGIDLTVTGGNRPFSYQWSNDSITEDLGNLAAGYYHVTVKELDNDAYVEAEITLTEPDQLQLSASVNVYGNGYNISCYHCFDGIITLNPDGGVTPYSYFWYDANTNQTHYALGAGSYTAIVTDLNGCNMNSEHYNITEPPRDDWTMSGNVGSNPNTQYLGTNDNKDFVFKTDSIERFRILNSGSLKINSLSGAAGMVYVDSIGVLRKGTTTTVAPCNGPLLPMWQGLVNPLNLFTCPQINVGIGTYSLSRLFTVNGSSQLISDNNLNALEILGGGAVPARRGIGLDNDPTGHFNFYIHGWQTNSSFNFINGQNSTNLMTIKSNGQVGIGIIPDPSSTSKLQVEGTIAAREVKVTTGAFPDFVFEPNYKLRSLKELENYISKNKHLPEISSAKEIASNGGIDLGEMNVKLLQKVEELTLYIIKQNKRIEVLEKKFKK